MWLYRHMLPYDEDRLDGSSCIIEFEVQHIEPKDSIKSRHTVVYFRAEPFISANPFFPKPSMVTYLALAFQHDILL